MKSAIQRNIVWLSISMMTWTMGATGVSYGADQPRQSVGSEANKVGDKELSAFVKAYVDYQKIRSNYTPVLERATILDKKSKLSRRRTKR